MKKRFLSLAMVLVLAISLLPVPMAAAAASYDVDAAIVYAKNHWNDGVGMCAEFVSKCVKAGGISMKTITTTRSCINTISSASGLPIVELKLDSNGYATKSANGNILAAGDPVVQYCVDHDKYPHIMFCGGYNSDGRATFYGHTAAINNKVQKLNVNTAYEHTKSCTIKAYTVHLASLDKGTTVPVTPKVSFALPTETTYKNKQKVTNTNAVVCNQITKTSGTKVTKMGLYLYDAGGKLLKKYTENVSNVGNTTTKYHSWYDINSELGITLTPGTTYKYKFFGVFNGSEVAGSTYSFQTTGSAPVTTYRVVFNLDEAGSSVVTRSITPGQAYGSLPTPYSKSGYTFDGFYTARTGGTKISSSTIFNGSSDITLYPHYTKDPVVEPPVVEPPVVEPPVVQPTQRTITLQIGNPYLFNNGTRQNIDNQGTVPILRNDRTLLPVRAVFEAMGGTVGWDGTNQVVSLSKDGVTLYLKIGSTTSWDSKGGYETLDTAPALINSRTMLPIRYVVEYFGGTVGWNNATQTVTITTQS